MVADTISQSNLLVEAYLKEKLNITGLDQQSIVDAMKYSLFAGGKRIRPFLMLEFYSAISGQNKNNIINFAAALEMIHTYSLIHDDLPCMDDDDFRRGKPSCHKVYGEAMALLAGDSLLTSAFSFCTDYDKNLISAENAIRAIDVLSHKSGILGMIGGQVIDIESEGKNISESKLKNIHLLKTSALISAACKMGALLAGADNDKLAATEKYAENIGLAFQIIDDVLDNTSTQEKLGKPIGSDQSLNKTTYFSLYGEEDAKKIAKELTDEAISALDIFDCDMSVLKEFAIILLNREA